MLISEAYRAANARLHDALPYYGSYGGRHAEQVRALMDRHAGGSAMQAADPALRAALGNSLHWVFVAMTVLSVVTLAAAWAMPQPDVEEPFRRRPAQPKPAG